jgi:hypothetical protein
MRVLCTGSRDWTNYKIIIDVLVELPSYTTIIHGGAAGLDTIVDIVARKLGFTVEVYEAGWKSKWDGLLRNSQMLYEGKPDLVLGFRSKLNSRGTNDMLKKAGIAGIEHRIYDDWK